MPMVPKVENDMTFRDALNALKDPEHWADGMGRKGRDQRFRSFPKRGYKQHVIRETGTSMPEPLTDEDRETPDWWINGFVWPDEGESDE